MESQEDHWTERLVIDITECADQPIQLYTVSGKVSDLDDERFWLASNDYSEVLGPLAGWLMFGPRDDFGLGGRVEPPTDRNKAILDFYETHDEIETFWPSHVVNLARR